MGAVECKGERSWARAAIGVAYGVRPFCHFTKFMYDENSKKIVTVAFVNPSWLSQAPVQEVRKLFMMRAIDFCDVAVAEALIDAGLQAGLKQKNNCSVRFITWD